MSLTAANEELEKIRMELDNRFFSNMQLGKIDPIGFEACY